MGYMCMTCLREYYKEILKTMLNLIEWVDKLPNFEN